MASFYEKDNPKNCNCLKDCFEDFDNFYARKINKPNLRINDFKTHWEKEIRDHNDCNGYCSLNGVSISKAIDNDSREKIIKCYSEMFPLAPGYLRYVCFFKFKNQSGRIKNTPSKKVVFHHDFYKEETFTISHIEVDKIETLQ